MRETAERPRESDQPRVREARPGTASATAEEIRTFLIADIREYTLFTQDHGDEGAARLAARFAGIVRQHVEGRDGSLLELRGDEALAVFRSPRQAIRAAVDLQARFLEETVATPDLPLPVGIGLDAGEAVAVEGGYRGGALNVAGRLCSEAGPGEILGTQSLVHLARTVEGVRYLDRGELHLKGLSEPVRVLAIASEGIDVAAQMRALTPKERRRRVYGGKMQFRVLGPLEVDAGGGPISLGGPKQRAVLAHLIMRANELVPAETLIDEIWGEEPPEKARNILQAYVSHLRKALGPDRIEWRTPGYRLRLDLSELDAARFDALMRDAKKALPVDPNIAVGALEDALALWRGPALADLPDQPSLLAEATRLDGLRLEAQEERIEGLLAIGAQARAIGELEVLVARHPLREALWGLLMLSLYREGRQADALAAYQRAREILADELGVDPSPELARLQERVLRQDPGLDLRGEALRGYRLLERIDEGPTGVVFRAIQPRVERDVAIKIFHEDITADPAFVRRFEQEAQAVAALEHPHIVPIHDYWREPGRAYIVSRYLRGGSLRGLEERGQSLEGDRSVRVIEQVASALAFAHRQGVAHGNVGSSSVRFDGEGNAYLGDFVVGIGPAPDPASDIRELARLARRWLGDGMPSPLGELCERAELGTEVAGADAFARAARDGLEGTALEQTPRADERNPYKGLRPFTEADARDFFGRGELTHRLVARLREGASGSRFLAVVGPSGSGKSSVVRAGLVPAIRHGDLGDPEGGFVAEMTPGAHPMEEIEAALLRIAVRPAPRLPDILDSGSRGLLQAVELLAPSEAEVVLIVDQFEETFTLCADEREREQFLESLRVATVDPESRLRVVLTLRADFYDRPLTYPRFGELLAASTEAVPPLTPDELEQAIRKPAEQVGVSAEPGLVAEMIAEVAHQPGALPLLQYALTELFERRDDDRMTLGAHRELGGVAAALSARADRILETTDPRGRRAIKQVFLKLVTLGEGTQDTRRRVLRSELDALEVDPAAIDGVLDAFGRHRFITFDRDPATREPTVEIAHEALLTAWGRLRSWIEDAREDLRQERRLARAAAEWRGSDRDPSFLMRGARLEQLAAWDAATDLAIGQPERAYLKASLDQRDRERAEEEERRAREVRMERRSRTRLRALVAVFAMAALVAGTLSVVAKNQSERAGREARRATARELASAAVANLDVDPERSILLAIQAVDETRSVDGTVLPEAEEALHRAVTASRVVLTVRDLGGKLDWSPAGVFVTEGPELSGMIDIRDASTGEQMRRFKGHDGEVTGVAFSSDGSKLATTGVDGWLKVWDPSTGDLLASLSGNENAFSPSFSADGSLVAAAWGDTTVQVLDTGTSGVVWNRHVPRNGDTDIALSPDGRYLATVGDRSGFVLNLDTGERDFELKGAFGPRISWSPDRRYIASTGIDGTPRVWDAKTGRLLFTLPGHVGFVVSLAWSPHPSMKGSDELVTGGTDGVAKVWSIRPDGIQEVESLSAQEMSRGIFGLAFSPDGNRVMAGGAAVKIWDLGPNGDAEWANIRSRGPAEFLPDERVVAPGVDATALAVWDARTGRNIRTIARAPFDIFTLDVSPDGRYVAAATYENYDCPPRESAGVWDMATGKHVFIVHSGVEGGAVIHCDVLDLAFSRDGKYLAAATVGDAKIYTPSGSRLLQTLSDSEHGMFRARFSSDGSLLATADYDDFANARPDRVRIWDWREGRVLSVIASRVNNIVFPLDFDPSGSRIVTIDPQGRAEILDVRSEKLVARLQGEPGAINDFKFSPDGSLVATAGYDGAVGLFEADTGARRFVLPGPCPVSHVSFSPDGTKLATTQGWPEEHVPGCGAVRIWALDIDDLLQIAREKVTRPLTAEECRQYLNEDRCPAP